MRKHLEIWGDKGRKDIAGYNSNLIFKCIAIIRSFMGIFDNPAGSRLIHPLSYFWISFRMLSGLLVMYMCIESPAILAFYWNANSCAAFPTRSLSLTIELLFLIEILLNFFVAYYDELSGGQSSSTVTKQYTYDCVFFSGEYIDDFSRVSKKYLAKGFLLDLFVSIPFTWAEYLW